MRMISKKANAKGEKEEKILMKIRGITLDDRSAKKLTFEKFKQMVENYGVTKPVEFQYTRLGPDKNSRVFSKQLKKRYKPVQTKGLISKKRGYKIYPFGYKKS